MTRSAKTIHRSSVLTHNHPEVTFGTFVALLLALHLFRGTVQSSQWACDLLTTHQSGTPPAVQSTLPPSFHSLPWHDPSRGGCVPTEQPAQRLLRSASYLPQQCCGDSLWEMPPQVNSILWFVSLLAGMERWSWQLLWSSPEPLWKGCFSLLGEDACSISMQMVFEINSESNRLLQTSSPPSPHVLRVCSWCSWPFKADEIKQKLLAGLNKTLH